jgi:RNA polymerase sigma-70 factor (ECF subfamily)
MNASKPAASGQVGEADERLLIEAAQREPARVAELYELNFERVYAFIVRRVRDRDLAEDLSAEVFHKALANLPRFKWRGAPFAAWLFRIATNLIADRAKRSARESDLSEYEDVAETSQINLEQVEQIALLFRLVGELPIDQRRVIAMRFAEEKSIREIAGELERSEGAIKQLQFRGLESLRAQLGVMQGEQDG